MPNIKIKQLDDRVATSGLFMGGDGKRRKLEPGEVVYIDKETLVGGKSLFDMLYNTGLVEMTNELITRPLDFESYREARFCSPTFKPNGPDEEREMNATRDEVAERLAAGGDVSNDEDASSDEVPVAEPPVGVTLSRRAARRALMEAQSDGEEDTT